MDEDGGEGPAPLGGMAMKSRLLATAALAALVVVLAPNALAHARAVVVQNDQTGDRCYVYTNDTEEPEYWIESNGVTTGGVPGGSPVDHLTGNTAGGSGLQRAPVGTTPADTRLAAEAWAVACTT